MLIKQMKNEAEFQITHRSKAEHHRTDRVISIVRVQNRVRNGWHVDFHSIQNEGGLQWTLSGLEANAQSQ